MNELIILCAKYLFIVSIIIFGVFWLSQPKSSQKSLAVTIIASGVIALILAKICGHFLYDARPFVSDHITPLITHANDNGFPSDHTLLTSLIGFVILLYSKKVGLVLLGIALVVGLARVAAGIHHPLDIFGSFVISGVATAATMYLSNQKRARKVSAKPES